MLYKRQIAVVFFVLLTVALAIPVSQAQARPGGLSDSQEPGSVLVFPFFETGTISTVDQGTLPQTSFEVSVTCPKTTPPTPCVSGQDVDIHFDWVCPGNFQKQCADANFTLTTTVHGTIRFDANGGPCFPGPSFVDLEGCGIPVKPPCEEGYLIGWVVDQSDNPIKFDGLIGDAVLREDGEGGSDGGTTSTAVTAYNAIPIQAGAALANGALIYSVTPPDVPGDLEFDGTHYQRVTGKIFGSVRFDNVTTTGSQKTYLALLTLDVRSNRLNPKIDVDLNFYNETEAPLSTNTSFFCFEETDSLSTINSSLTSAFCSAGGAPADPGCKGEVESTKAVTDVRGTPVTLLGLIITREFDASNNLLREYAYPFANDSTPVDTDFVP